MNIGKQIKKLRKVSKLTQKNFAKRVGVGFRFIRELEQGKPTIRIDKLNQVLEFLGYHLALIRNTSDYYNQKELNKFAYSMSFKKELKSKIRKRDKYKCQICGIHQRVYKEKTNKHLSVHHIDHDKQNCDEDNLISLCNKCHGLINKNKDIWVNFFNKIVKKNNCGKKLL